MADAPIDVTGKGPIAFTTTKGKQCVVPLSALQIPAGSRVPALKGAWQTVFAPDDKTTLLALATSRLAAGELSTVPPVLPAIRFDAATVGYEGNEITIDITADATYPVSPKITLQATENYSYSGLHNAGEAADSIGVDMLSWADGAPPVGTGLVQVMMVPPSGVGLPKDKQSFMLNNDTLTAEVLDVNDKELFTLVARKSDFESSGDDPAVDSIKVDIATKGNKFTVTVTVDSDAPKSYSDFESVAEAAKTINDAVLSEAGVVQVLMDPPPGSGLPKKDGQKFTLSSSTLTAPVLDANDKELFTLVARKDVPQGPAIKVTVTVDANTFKVATTYDSGSKADVTVDQFPMLPAAIAFLVKASLPASGKYGLPALTPVQLSGGTATQPASGIAYVY